MKVNAIMLVLLAAPTAVSAKAFSPHHYNADADPCKAFDKKDCLSDGVCMWQQGPRKVGASRKAEPTHHSVRGGAGHYASCQMPHLFQRVNMSVNDKKRVEGHGLNTEWADMECKEAYYLKDCKDLNQKESGKCAWTCEGGCKANEGEKVTYDVCEAPVVEGFTDLYVTHGFTGYPVDDNACVSLDENGGTGNEWNPPTDGNPEGFKVFSEEYVNACFDACIADPKCAGDIALTPGGEDDLIAVIYPGDDQNGTCHCYTATAEERLTCSGYYNMFIKNAHSQYEDLTTNRIDTCTTPVNEDYRYYVDGEFNNGK